MGTCSQLRRCCSRQLLFAKQCRRGTRLGNLHAVSTVLALTVSWASCAPWHTHVCAQDCAARRARCTELLLAVTAPRVLMMTFACYMSANLELTMAFAGVVDVSVLCFVAMLTGGCAASSCSSMTAQAFFDNAAVPLHGACHCLLAMHIRSSRCAFRDCIESIGHLQVHGWY